MGVLSYRVYIEWIKRDFKKWKVSNKGNYRRKENKQPKAPLMLRCWSRYLRQQHDSSVWHVSSGSHYIPFSLGFRELLLACSWALTIGTHMPCFSVRVLQVDVYWHIFLLLRGNDRSLWKVMNCDLKYILIGAKSKHFWLIIINLFLQILSPGIHDHKILVCFPTEFLAWIFFNMFEFILLRFHAS